MKIGEVVLLETGAFKGSQAEIKDIQGNVVKVEFELFGRKTIIDISPVDLSLQEKGNTQTSLTEIIQAFDRIYGAQAPLRYAQLQQGASDKALEAFRQENTLEALPEEFITLYSWKNGMITPVGGWKNEFENEEIYELIPLDAREHWCGLSSISQLLQTWQVTKQKDEVEGLASYWKDGFIPFVELQNYGLLVIDTKGYFEGEKNQIVSFDYKSGNGYRVRHQNLTKWLETKLELLKSGLLFASFSPKVAEIEKSLNYEYLKRFPTLIS